MISLFQQIDYMNSIQFIILTLVLVISMVFFQRMKNQRQISLAAQIPGPNGLFILGNAMIATGGLENMLEKLKLLCEKHERSLFKLWFFNKLIVCISNAEDIEQVWNSSNCFQRKFPFNLMQDVLTFKNGILMKNNINDHKKSRKIISEWLKFSNLKLLIRFFYEESKVLEHILSEKRNRKSFECEISRVFALASMDSIGRTALGEEFQSQNKGYHVFQNSYERLTKIYAYRISYPWFYFSSLFSLSSKIHEQRNSQRLMCKFVNDLIEKKEIELNNKAKLTVNESNDADCFYQEPKSLIEILLASDHQIPRDEIRDELLTIISAGHDSTAISNTLVIFMLAHHQDVQQNVYEEINSIFSTGDVNRPPTYEDLQKMELLERVIKETMRMYPPVPMLFKAVENEMMIGKYRIPAGTDIMIPIYCLHSNPQYFKDPEKFNPDNFLPDVCRSRHPYAYNPFGGGLRVCVGIKYTMLQMKTEISTLVRSYRFSPSEKCPTPKDLKLSVRGLLVFVNGCYVKIESRS